jgi:serralysin
MISAIAGDPIRRWPSAGDDARLAPFGPRGDSLQRADAAPALVLPSGVDTIDGMLSGLAWLSSALTYSFPTDGVFYEESGGYEDGAEQDQNFEALNPQQQQAVTALLAAIASVTDLTFTLVTESAELHGDLRFAMSEAAEVAYAYLPSGSEVGGDSWYNNTSGDFDAPVLGNYSYMGMLHEIGHALGLDHPFDPNVYGAIPLGWDSTEYTVMTYRSALGSDILGYTNAEFGFAQSLMMLDIAALQYMYGADFSLNATDTIYTWSETSGEMFINGVGQGVPGGNTIFLTIWDGGGVDTYDFSNYTTNLIVDLEPGYYSTTAEEQLALLDVFNDIRAGGNIFNSLLFEGESRSLIENAIGGDGDDTFFGNNADNFFIGGYGADYFVADIGADTYVGGTLPANDSFGIDLVSYELSLTAVTINTVTGVNIGSIAVGDTYQLIDGFVGSLFGDTITAYGYVFGIDGNDTLKGFSFDDTLDGGAGDDLLLSSAGEDDFIGGTGMDTVSYAALGARVSINLTSGNHGNGEEFRDSFSGVELIIGTSLNDQLIGNGLANQFDGGFGDDNLQGMGGDDILSPGSGANTLDGGAGNDIVSYANVSPFGGGITYIIAPFEFKIGEISDDTLTSIEGIIGTNRADRIELDNAANYIDGGGGDDRLRGFGGADTMLGGAGVDDIHSGADNDTVDGGDGNDLIAGSLGNDIIAGGDGDDLIDGGSGADQINGGLGIDTAGYSNSAGAVRVNLSSGAGLDNDAQGDVFSSIEIVVGSAFDDRLTGSANADTFRGGAGIDTLLGQNGNDVLEGGEGADVVNGGNNDDVLIGGAGADQLTGGAGIDTADYSASLGAIRVNLGSLQGLDNDAAGDRFNSVEIVIGTNFDDRFTGGDLGDTFRAGQGADTLLGQNGDDVLDGGAGVDNLNGGNGNDYLIGGAGADQISGGTGTDTLDYSASAGGVRINISANQGLDNDAQGDRFNSVEVVIGSNFNDRVTGTTQFGDDFRGGLGDDTLLGQAGNDILQGQGGNDTLTGGANDDMLNGGLGADAMNGGAGLDAFVFADVLGVGNVDSITGFSVADDVIHLSTAIFGVAAGTLAASAFTIGATAADADDRIIYNSATGALLYDADGDGVGAAVQFATLTSGLALTNADFFGFTP